MGGWGSGRWGSHWKATTVEACIALSVRDLRAKGVFGPSTWGWAGNVTRSRGGQILEQVPFILKAHALGTWEAHLVVELGHTHQNVPLVERSFRFGGRSWWLACPGCGARCLKLYLPPSAWRQPSPFRCRSCWRLAYTSSQEAHQWDRGLAGLLLAPIATKAGCSLAELERVMRSER